MIRGIDGLYCDDIHGTVREKKAKQAPAKATKKKPAKKASARK